MGTDEYRTPLALGGIVSTYIYRSDLEWLHVASRRASRWMSGKGRPVSYSTADVIHKLIRDAKKQIVLDLEPRLR